ncbi:mannosyl-glycoprotein endo-beta-N-acetylglucosaminidase [Cellulophaga phage Omtje_3]|uniref:Mannosyl-glycoprotein endo-beta-N-acetylglucosaminidase n=1 Tax=Cellulophaga phage Omtje_1 TaxID=2745694 RepID=A0A8E4ZIX1_9VIRU|nr:mannosyl-glycoprotein endo-beta-N-acetylglucosaminidase [Cellulophaga phage Omtje_1]QQV90361.1 mannosyl-glycoprotein endo-beta-N-acetylglucosaminidase [Cellulophaga phage Omtje_2]QQV90374.1 mannosyl-glycoprotein endo-beta-N-acetylglucosaminidase [Cellulophaga phage Omtje_3]QQV90387.1 mannosyl-glycoprotein endo-beta-N-acetylglucosaminidase [Cellulophaga phage Omtje_4]QQV90400.1 mannosyl-glycoprotein endo-beta-N-acetylglucosaminidase [Cellulophaga phage Omtje_5]
MKSTLNKIKIWLLIWFYKNTNGYSNISVKLLYAQAWHETGDFKSPVYEQNKNLFGMRHPSKRKTLSQGSNLSHAVFKNHKDSIVDYFYRQQNFRIPNTSDTLYMQATVKSGYAEDTSYLTKWESIYKKMKFPVSNKLLYFLGVFFLVLIMLPYIKRLFAKNGTTQTGQTININSQKNTNEKSNRNK